jgi:RNA polymerase sigma-70 factor (ECF subfamily)
MLARFSAGDEAALGELYDRWSSAVHAVAASILHDADEAEDVVEETFWQAWRQRDGYSAARGTISAWLLTIARTRALDRLRGRKRRREDPLEMSGPTLAGRSNPARDLETAERGRLLQECMAALPLEQREAIHLAYWGGLSQSEIAAHTAQPIGTVKTRVRLAMQKLRAQLIVLREEGG